MALKVVRETGLKYMMAETVVYSREFLYIRELYEKGELGKIQGWAKIWAPDCENSSSKLRQKGRNWEADCHYPFAYCPGRFSYGDVIMTHLRQSPAPVLGGVGKPVSAVKY